MKLSHFILTVIVSCVVAVATTKYVARPADSVAITESAYDRVLRTGEVRCGYNIAAPYLTKDAASGQMGGIWYALTEAIAAHLGLKIVWAQEIGLGEIATALQAKRIDMFCGGLWTAGQRVRAVDFLKPSAFEPLLVYVRNDDHRFDDGIDGIDDPALRISAIDGEGGGLAAQEAFPKATLVSLPQSASYADMFNQVVASKADALLSAPSGAAAFIKNNPGTLRPLATHPIRVFPVAFAVAYGEDKWRDMLNQAQDDILTNGIMDKIIDANEVNKGDFWRVASPYSKPQ